MHTHSGGAVKYIVAVDGQRITVELDGIHATVDGERFDVGLVPIPGTPVRLVRVNEQVHRLMARRGGARGSWRLDLDGIRLDVEALDERMRAIRDVTLASTGPSGPAPLLAPMPGLVVRISVQAGDVVAVGQALVAVEAMKMENELRATAPAVVLVVRAVVGTAVDKGAVLVELGPIPAS